MERGFVREDSSVGGDGKNSMWHRLNNVTTYVCVLSNTFSLLEDIHAIHANNTYVIISSCVKYKDCTYFNDGKGVNSFKYITFEILLIILLSGLISLPLYCFFAVIIKIK